MTASLPHQIAIEIESPNGSAWPTWYVAGWLTIPERLKRHELQILVHGAGADHRYWNWPLRPEIHSYARWAASNGIATLSIDRVGCGSSCRPPGTETTVDAQAAVLHQSVATARQGNRSLPRFERVVFVGHSMGSVIVGYEAATYRDVDAAILTGYIPIDGTVTTSGELVSAFFAPAGEVLPHLIGLVDEGYVASRPGAEKLLYRQDNADHDIIELERQMQGAATSAEILGAGVAGPTIRNIRIPTLVIVGQYDALLYDPSTDPDTHAKVSYWSQRSPANMSYDVVSNTGHCLNLERSAPETFRRMEQWLSSQSGA